MVQNLQRARPTPGDHPRYAETHAHRAERDSPDPHTISTTTMRWLLRHEWAAPLGVLAVVMLLLARLDEQQRSDLRNARAAAESEAQHRASRVGGEISNVISARVGALSTAKLNLTQVSDSVSEHTFFAALDSATRDAIGLSAISLVGPNGELRRGSTALVGSGGLDLTSDSVVADPFQRAPQHGRVVPVDLDPLVAVA